MERIHFWQEWQSGYKTPFKIFGIALGALILMVIVAMWRSPAPTVTWQFIQEREAIEKVVHQFQTGPFTLQVQADNVVLFEKLLGNEWRIESWPAYLFVGIVLMGIALLVAILSTLSRFWFFIGSGLLIFLITSLRLELLYVLGNTNQWAAIFLMVIVVGSGLWFQYYFQVATFSQRLLIYMAIIFGSFGLIAILADAPEPVFYLAVAFIPSTVLLSCVLAIFIAHEIIATIVYLITRSIKGSNGFAHFVILSSIYLLNLIAMYLNDEGYIDWEFTVSPILLLALSAVLSVWGIRRQQEQMDTFILTGPLGPLSIIGLSVIAFSSCAFYYTTGNDAAIETIRNISLYSHIGYGFIFMLYTIANFGQLLRENYPVSKILYKPKTMPYFTFRLAGSIVLLGFILYNFWKRPISDTIGAREAAMGDYYLTVGNMNLAEGFYKKSETNAFHNHHANYILANIEGRKGSTTEERFYYLNAAERRPTEQAYMNAINTLDQSAINIYTFLRMVRKDFPESGAANNALGLVHARLGQLDSAFYFFNLAKRNRLTYSTAEINLLATAVRQNLELNVDSLYQSIDHTKPGQSSNALAFANRKDVFLEHELNLDNDTTLNLFRTSLIHNYFINHKDSLDTVLISKAEKLARRPTNFSYQENILIACAFASYQSGQISRAFKLMQEATVGSSDQGRLNNTMALWALDQMAPTVALDYVQYSIYKSFPAAILTKAIALAEYGQYAESIVLFDSVKKSSTEIKPIAESMQRSLLVDKSFVHQLSDMEKYSFCRYRLDFKDSLDFRRIANTIEGKDWKARAILDRSKKLFELDERQAAIQVFNLLTGLEVADMKLFDDIQRHELLLLASTGNTELMISKMKEGITWPRYKSGEKLYCESFVALGMNDTVRVQKNIEWLSENNPYFDEGVLAAYHFTKQKSKDKLEAYTILANSLQANPQSVKLLKAYTREAKELGFDDFADNSIETLRKILPGVLFEKFMETLD
jgi:hypothetical protein